jgi:hypothetical protein
MAKKPSRDRQVQSELARVRALTGGTPPAALRKKPISLEAEFKARAKLRREQWAAMSRHTAAVLKPFHKIIAADKEAMAAANALKNNLKKRPRRQKLPKPVAPKIGSLIRSSSLLTFRPAPFDQSWAAGTTPWNSGTGGLGSADRFTGEFGARCQVAEGAGSVGAGSGVSVWFQPIKDNVAVRFAPNAQGYGQWDDKSWFGATAHNNGFIRILVESWNLSGDDFNEDVKRDFPQWSDATGWWDEHGFDQIFGIFFPVDTIFIASTNRWYRCWTVAGVYCDGSGDQQLWGSQANSNLQFQLHWVVFEQWV